MRSYGKKIGSALALACFLLLGACSARVSTEDIRSSLNAGNYEDLQEKMQTAHEEHQEFVTALNLARVYQLQGRWRESIALYDSGLRILEEYEQRAIINLREALGTVGSILIARGSKDYFGTGYERTLLHTFNSLNYLMLGDFTGAMVEMRKMEQRQELWLAEEERRLQEHLEDLRERSSANYDDLSGLPANYTMTALLNDPRTKAVARSYQDAFSYSLSAIVCRLAGDPDYAAISLRRAALLDQNARILFSAAWGKGKITAGQWEPVIPKAPSAQPSLARVLNVLKPSSDAKGKNSQEISVIVFCGLAPALHMERVRIPAPYIGYVLVDLPAFFPPLQYGTPTVESSTGQGLPLYALLHTDLLAYRTLKDELRYEVGSAIARAVSRAAIAGATYAAAASNKNTQSFAPLLGALATGIMDLFSSGASQNVRNWELLPAEAYLSQGQVRKGESVRIQIEREMVEIDLPQEANGVIIIVSHAAKAKMRVDYVAY
ncbi:MAG: hypothetical protein LBM00_09775 [Deltaproteobacteria bacterium]|nr:hypothetical protein [Deltaproteobacteria bacterium]